MRPVNPISKHDKTFRQPTAPSRWRPCTTTLNSSSRKRLRLL